MIYHKCFAPMSSVSFLQSPSYILRSFHALNLKSPSCRTNAYSNSFFPTTNKLWNSHSPHIKDSKSINQLKNKLYSTHPSLISLYNYIFIHMHYFAHLISCAIQAESFFKKILVSHSQFCHLSQYSSSLYLVN